MAWFALLIPIGISLALKWRFPHEMAWWELLLPMLVSVIIIAICTWGSIAVQTHDTETWGGWITSAAYFEAWNERVSCRHPIYHTDKKGNQTIVGYEHLYDVDYHPEHWDAYGSNGEETGITQSFYSQLCSQFGNKVFRDLHRHYHTINGNAYDTKWPANDESMVTWSTRHSYENRVQASHSLFNFPEVSKADQKRYALYDYPEIDDEFNYQCVLCPDTKCIGNFYKGHRELQVANAKLGASKQVRIWILIYREQPLEAALVQKDFWKGGNKNELVVCVGLDKESKINWCYTFSWCDGEQLKVDAKDQIAKDEGKPLILDQYVEWLVPQVEQLWQRKHFKDFAYLSVDLPMWMVLLTYFLTTVASLGAGYWSLVNEFTDESPWGP